MCDGALSGARRDETSNPGHADAGRSWPKTVRNLLPPPEVGCPMIGMGKPWLALRLRFAKKNPRLVNDDEPWTTFDTQIAGEYVARSVGQRVGGMPRQIVLDEGVPPVRAALGNHLTSKKLAAKIGLALPRQVLARRE